MTVRARDLAELRMRLTVLRCQTGDARAFEQLYDAFAARTQRYLRGLVGADAAEDAQQETWLAVYRHIAGLANPGGFRTWLFSVARHRAIDALRKHKRAQTVLAMHGSEIGGPANSAAAEEPLRQEELHAVMDALSPAHREVLLLRYWDDMSYTEIALVVGCSIGTVRSRLHNAKLRVRELLQDLAP